MAGLDGGEGPSRPGPVRETLVARAHLVCGECFFAQLIAVEPRAVCTCPEAECEGRLVFSGRPACDHVRPRHGDERTSAWCALRLATERLGFTRARPRSR